MNDTPINEIKFGQNNDYIKAAIWENKSQKGTTYHSVKLSRCYRDNDGWHETQTLFAHHLPLAQLASEKAFGFIHEQIAQLRDQKASQQQDEEAEKPAPATKRGRKKSHVDKLDEERTAKTTAKGK